jgi:hypothetical protein
MEESTAGGDGGTFGGAYVRRWFHGWGERGMRVGRM